MVLPMQKYQLNSLDFVINRLFMKLKPATFVSSNYAKNCFILNCRVFGLLVVEEYFQIISFACKCLLVKVVFVLVLFFFIIYHCIGE